MQTCSSSAKHKPQSRWDPSEPWPTREPELLPAPHLRAKTPGDKCLYLGSKKLFFLFLNQKSDAPLPVWGGIVVFLMSGVCVVWPRWGGRFVPKDGGEWREGGSILGLRSVLGLAVKKKNFITASELVLFTGYLFIYKSTTSTDLKELRSQAAPTWVRFSAAIGLDWSSQSGPRLVEWSYSSPRADSWCCL